MTFACLHAVSLAALAATFLRPTAKVAIAAVVVSGLLLTASLALMGGMTAFRLINAYDMVGNPGVPPDRKAEILADAITRAQTWTWGGIVGYVTLAPWVGLFVWRYLVLRARDRRAMRQPA